MQEYMKISDASVEDMNDFSLYIKTISRLEKMLDEIREEDPNEIFDAIHNAKVQLENDFIAFVKALQPYSLTKEVL